MENQEQKDKPQGEIEEQEEIKEETVEEVQGEVEEENQTQVEEVGPMEEKAQVEAIEEQKGGRGLIYLALVFAIVALVLSFWNVGVQRVVKVLEKRENVLEQKTEALEKTLAGVQAQALLSQLQMEAHRIYVLTMGERNYEAAARVLSAMEGQVDSLKAYYSAQSMSELEALLGALKREVAKGPSPIPGLVAQIQFVTDKMREAPKVVLPAPAVAPVPEAKPSTKEAVVKKAPKEEAAAKPQKKVVKPQAGVAPEGKGPLYNLLKSWDSVGKKLMGK